MDKPSLRQRVLARLKFNPGIPALRLAIAVGVDPIRVSPTRSAAERVPHSFRLLLQEMLKDGEIQEWHPAIHQEAVYYPAGHALPKLSTAQGNRTTDNLPQETGRASINRRNFEQVSEALWKALDELIELGEPFALVDVPARVGLSYTVIYTRPALKRAIEEAIAIQGRRATENLPSIKKSA